MGLAHWSGIAHPVKPARGRLAQGPPGKIPNARRPRLMVPPPTDCRCAPGTTAAPRFALPTVSRPYHVRRPLPQAARSLLSPHRCGPLIKRSRSPLPFPALSLSPDPLLRLPLSLPTNHLDKHHQSRPVISYFHARAVPQRRAAGCQGTPWSEPMSSLSTSVSTSPRTGRSGPPPSTPVHPRAPSPPCAPHRHLQPRKQLPHGSLTGATLRLQLRRHGQPCRVRLFLHR
jgi:hypothetical protein